MSHGKTYFPTKGACIYCGSRSELLTDEHILPLSLGGVHIIEKASCINCNKITTKFEHKIARGLWGDARISFDAPSRRKKKREKFIEMSDPENLNKKIRVLASEYPAGFVFYKMGPPGLLQGLGEDVDISSSWEFTVVSDSDRRKEFLRKYGDKLTLTFRHVPREFGQLLCKIAHGHLLTALNLEDFSPLCLPYIMGEKTNVSHLVGGVSEYPVPNPDLGYLLRNCAQIVWGRTMFLIVEIRLYSNTHAPGYQVVAGKVEGDENIKRVLGKLGPGRLMERSSLVSPGI